MSDFFKRIENQKACEDRQYKEMVVKLSRKAITDYKNIKLKNLNIEISVININNEPSLSITVYRKLGGNCSYTFYSFQPAISNESKYKSVLKIIKTDDFSKIEAHAKYALLNSF